MTATNPYASLYEQNLAINIEEKASILKPLQLDHLKERLNDLKSTRNKERTARKYGKSDDIAFSPYQMRVRKKTITAEGGASSKDCVMPLRRISPRLNGRDVNSPSEKPLADETIIVSKDERKPRQPEGPLEMMKVVQEVEKEDWQAQLREVGCFMRRKKCKSKSGVDVKNVKNWTSAIDAYKTEERQWQYPKKTPADNLDRFKEKASKLSMWCGSLARVLRERVTSMAVHPSKECLIVAVGGRNGSLGLWVVCPAIGNDDALSKKVSLEQNSAATGVYTFEPHSSTISCTSFCEFSGDKIITSSYDGTVRTVDMEKLVFHELFTSPLDLKYNWMQWHCQLSPHVFLLAQGSGNVFVVDDRSPCTAQAVLRCYERSCRSLSIHPIHPMYLATASSLGWASIWDLRKFGSKVSKKKDDGLKGVVQSSAAICHLGTNGRAVSSAFFSPVTGSGLLTTCSDDYIRIYDTSKLAESTSSTIFRVETGIKHCNRTGQWLTPFKATWHPQRDDAFVVGSLSNPRQVDIFGRHGRLLCAPGKSGPFPINTVCPVNAFHPNRFLLLSADSAGRVHLLL